MGGGFQGSGFGAGFQTEEIVSLQCSINNQSSLTFSSFTQYSIFQNISNESSLSFLNELISLDFCGNVSNESNLAAASFTNYSLFQNISNESSLSPQAVAAVAEVIYGNIGNESGISIEGTVIEGATEKIGAFSSAFFSPDFFDTEQDVTIELPDLSNWSEVCSFIINGSPDGNFENYQIKVTIPYQSFMQTNFADIRFTLVDGVTEIPYYLQSYTSGVSATFVLNIPNITEGTSNSQEIMVYAGNDNVTTTSNPDAVYMDYDDFENNLSTKWTVTSGNWSESNNQLIAVSTASDGCYAYLTGSNFGACIIEVDVIPDSSFRFGINFGGSETNQAIYDSKFGFNTPTSSNITLVAGTKYHLTLEIKPNGTIKFSCNGVLQVSETLSEVPTGYVGLRKWYIGQALFENFSVSQTTNNPPTVGALSSWVANVTPPVPLIGGILNTSSLSAECGAKFAVKSAISNLSGMNYSPIGVIFLSCMMAENSLIRANMGIKSHLGMMASNLATMYPIIVGDHVYVSGNISNISNLLATLPQTVFYDIEDIQGDIISTLAFEPVYQGNNTSVQPVVLKNLDGNADLNINITSRSSLAPQALESLSENSYEYIQVSLTGNAGDWHSSINVDLPQDGSVTFYVQADIPANAVPGSRVCELTTTTTLNGTTYTQNLILSGTTLTGNPVVQTAGVNNPPVIAEMADGKYDNITKFDIVDTINAVVKTFEVDYTAGTTGKSLKQVNK